MNYAEQSDKLAGPIGLLKTHISKSGRENAEEAVQIFGGRALTVTGMGKFIENFHRTSGFDASECPFCLIKIVMFISFAQFLPAPKTFSATLVSDRHSRRCQLRPSCNRNPGFAEPHGVSTPYTISYTLRVWSVRRNGSCNVDNWIPFIYSQPKWGRGSWQRGPSIIALRRLAPRLQQRLASIVPWVRMWARTVPTGLTTSSMPNSGYSFLYAWTSPVAPT
jgi:hypothetical protein